MAQIRLIGSALCMTVREGLPEKVADDLLSLGAAAEMTPPFAESPS